MSSEKQRYLLSAASGAIAGAIAVPIIAGAVPIASFVLVFLIGGIFGVISLIALAAIYPAARVSIGLKSWFLSLATLVVGVPAALISGFAASNTPEHVVPSYQVEGIGLSFFFAEIVSCVVWSLFLCLSLLLLCRVRLSSFLVPSFATTLSVMIVMNIIYAVFMITIQKEIPLLAVISITEQIASAILLAVGVSRGIDDTPQLGAAARL